MFVEQSTILKRGIKLTIWSPIAFHLYTEADKARRTQCNIFVVRARKHFFCCWKSQKAHIILLAEWCIHVLPLHLHDNGILGT